MDVKIIDTASFACTGCDEAVGLTQVILTEGFEYLFFAKCEKCGGDNFFKLVKILNSLSIKVIAPGSERIN